MPFARRRQEQYPFLTEYIKYAVAWRPGMLAIELTPLTVLLGFGIAVAVGTFVELAMVNGPLSIYKGAAAGIGAFAIYWLGAYGILPKMPKKDANDAAKTKLRRDARTIANRLEEIMDKKRLHRDLSAEVVTMLEEAARNWHRARTALESPYWRKADLPVHLRTTREQCLLAIDQSMQELMVLFSTSIPKEPSKWTFSEVVDEVIGQDFLTTKGRLDHISPFYEDTRQMVGRLSEMADQVDEVSRRLACEEMITGTAKPGSALEATLAELRQIKQAEEELNRDLRH